MRSRNKRIQVHPLHLLTSQGHLLASRSQQPITPFYPTGTPP